MTIIKNKILIILVSLVALISLAACSDVKSETNIPSEDKKVIEDFLDLYLGQFKYSEEDWEDLIRYLDSRTLDDKQWMAQWEEILTEKEIERLVNNRLLPNLSLKEYSGTEYAVEELKSLDETGDYLTIVKLDNTEDNGINKTINIPLNIIDTEEGRRINYIDLEEFNSLFN